MLMMIASCWDEVVLTEATDVANSSACFSFHLSTAVAAVGAVAAVVVAVVAAVAVAAVVEH